MASNFKTIRKVISTAGTPVQIATGFGVATRCEVSAPVGNAGLVYFGNSDLSATARRSLDPGTSFSILSAIDISKMYVDGAVNGYVIEIVFYF